MFQLRHALYRNLIEPWRKALHSLGLQGERFETWGEVAKVTEETAAYRSRHSRPKYGAGGVGTGPTGSPA